MSIHEQITRGECCAECLTPFVGGHGYPVLCKYCMKHAPKDTPYQPATLREAP